MKLMTFRRNRNRQPPLPPAPKPDPRKIFARQLDLFANLELQHGHHLAAERLSWRAAELREAAR